MRSASFKLVSAAAAVRIFERIDTHMPTYPAITEQMAPNKNESVIQKAICIEDSTGSKSR